MKIKSIILMVVIGTACGFPDAAFGQRGRALTRIFGAVVKATPKRTLRGASYGKALKPSTLPSIRPSAPTRIAKPVPSRPAPPARKVNPPALKSTKARTEPVPAKKWEKKSTTNKRKAAEAKLKKNARSEIRKQGSSEHVKNKRRSTKEKHQKGRARLHRDNRNESGDARRPY